VLFCPFWSAAVPVDDEEDDVDEVAEVDRSLDSVEVISCVIVDPLAVLACVTVVALGVGVADVEGGCVEDEEKDDELEELNVKGELDDGVVLICEEEDVELREKLEEDGMGVEESEVETGVGLLLAIELDDIWEELDGAEGAEVDDTAAREDGVLVELDPDIVNCLPKTSFLGCLQRAMSARKNLNVRCKQLQYLECGVTYLDQRLPVQDPQLWVGRKQRVDVSNSRKERRTCSLNVVIQRTTIALNGWARAVNGKIESSAVN
jgi:hypothetical protein